MSLTQAEIDRLVNNDLMQAEIEASVGRVLKRKRKWRWKALSVYLAVFSVVIILAYLQGRSNTASNSDLQKTNCALKTFLLTASNARASTYNRSHKLTDKKAALGYRTLAVIFTATGKCNEPTIVALKD